MARVKSSKSDEVRKILAEQPNLSGPEVVEMLKAKGITITSGLVYAIKAKAKATSKRPRKQRRKPARRVASKATVNGSVSLTLLDIEAIKALSGKLGKEDLKAAIDIIG